MYVSTYIYTDACIHQSMQVSQSIPTNNKRLDQVLDSIHDTGIGRDIVDMTQT